MVFRMIHGARIPYCQGASLLVDLDFLGLNIIETGCLNIYHSTTIFNNIYQSTLYFGKLFIPSSNLLTIAIPQRNPGSEDTRSMKWLGLVTKNARRLVLVRWNQWMKQSCDIASLRIRWAKYVQVKLSIFFCKVEAHKRKNVRQPSHIIIYSWWFLANSSNLNEPPHEKNGNPHFRPIFCSKHMSKNLWRFHHLDDHTY